MRPGASQRWVAEQPCLLREHLPAGAAPAAAVYVAMRPALGVLVFTSFQPACSKCMLQVRPYHPLLHCLSLPCSCQSTR